MNARTPPPEPVELSVVVVAFAGGEHPRRCLAALGAQRLPADVRLQVVLAHDDRLAGILAALRETLPAVQMPNRENWAPLPDWAAGTPRLPGYPY